MRALILAAALAASAPFGVAYAAGPFDGQYSGGAGPTGGRGGCPATIARVTIADGKMTGQVEFLKYTYPIAATVAPDGTVTGKWATNPMSGKFIGTHFEGVYSSKECGTDRKITLDKTG